MAKSARENILQKIKQALAKPVPVPFTAVDSVSTTYPSTKEDRKSVVQGKSVDLGGRRLTKRKKTDDRSTWRCEVSACTAVTP